MISPLALLRTEWLKIKSFRPFWALFWLYPVCLFGMLGVGLWGQLKVQHMAGSAPAAAGLKANLPFAFPHAWQSVSYLASWLFFIPALLLILNITNEFTFRTHRQNLLEGWSRGNFLLSKALLVVGVSLFCTLAVGVGILGAGLLSGSTPSPEGASHLGAFLLQTLIYQAFALLLAFTIRRAALALGAFLIYASVLETFLRFLIDRQWSGWGSYLPLKIANALLPIPFLKENAPKAAAALLAGPDMSLLLTASAVYLAAFAALLAFRFGREDL